MDVLGNIICSFDGSLRGGIVGGLCTSAALIVGAKFSVKRANT